MVDCYVLSNGARVISMRSAVLAIAKVDSGNLGEYIGVEALKPFIDKDKVLGETHSFSKFLRANGKSEKGEVSTRGPL